MPKLVLVLDELRELGRKASFNQRRILPENVAELSRRQLPLSSLSHVPVDREGRDAVEDVGFRVWDPYSVLDSRGHKRVVDHRDSGGPRCQGSHEGRHRVAEVGRGGLEGRHELGGKLGGGVWVRGRRGEGRDLQAVEMEEAVGGLRGRVPAVESELGLVDVGGGRDVVDGDAVGSDEAGQVEELVEVALCRQRDHDHHHLARCGGRHHFPAVDGVWVVGRGSHQHVHEETKAAKSAGKITRPQ